MAVDFDKCRKENNFNCLNLSNMARGTVIQQVILAQIRVRQAWYSRSQIFMKL